MLSKSKIALTQLNSAKRNLYQSSRLTAFRPAQQMSFGQQSINMAQFSSSNRGGNQSESNGNGKFMFGSLMALGGLSAAAAMYMNQSNTVAEASEGVNEVQIPFASSLEEGQMKVLKVGEGNDQKVLIARYNGKLYSTGNFCSHFGVPLNNGMLFDDKVLCPAHAAGFSIITGQPETAPGLDGIPSFPVVERDGQSYVQIPQDGLPRKVPMPLTKRDPNNTQHYVIVGGGPAGLNCAETLRQSGFSGQITLVSKEKAVPYDRTLLSKALAGGDASKWALRPQEFLDEADIDIKLGGNAFSLKPAEKKVILTNGDKLIYDKLMIATGSHAWAPPVEGLKLKNVHPLRTDKDMANIQAACKDAKNIVIIGASFIGSECAASLKQHYKDAVNITMVNGDDTPFKLTLGKELGAFYQKEHESNGVSIINKVFIKSANAGEDGKTVKSVSLSDGNTLDADVVILGTGVRPNTKWLEGSGIELDKQGGLICDPFMQTNKKDIFAAGDIASVPYWPTGSRTRIEHWVVALEQGTNAAWNMMDKFVPYSGIPFFWTRHYNKSLQFIGNNAVGYSEVVVKGKMDKHKFLVYYINDKDQVVAVAGMGKPKAMLTLLTAMEQNLMPVGSLIKSGREKPGTIKLKLKQNVGGGKCKRANCCQKKSVVA